MRLVQNVHFLLMNYKQTVSRTAVQLFLHLTLTANNIGKTGEIYSIVLRDYSGLKRVDLNVDRAAFSKLNE